MNKIVEVVAEQHEELKKGMILDIYQKSGFTCGGLFSGKITIDIVVGKPVVLDSQEVTTVIKKIIKDAGNRFTLETNEGPVYEAVFFLPCSSERISTDCFY